MADPAAPKPALPAHPLTRSSPKLVVLGSVYLACGLCVMVAYAHLAGAGAVAAAFGALLLAAALRQRRVLPAVMLNNAAHDLLTQGRYDEALALLDTIPPAHRTGLVGMAALSQRAYVLLAQGDAAGAVAASTQALALKVPLVARAQGRQYRLALLANRALMLSATDDAAAARAVAAEVESAAHATPLHRGLAALARAVTYARAGERADLAAELSRSRAALEQLTGREAMLARTLARVAAAPPGGAYRTSAAREGSSLSAVGRWVVTMVPSAAPFAPRAAEGHGAVDPARLPAPTSAAFARALADHARVAKHTPNPARTLGIAIGVATVVVCTALFVALPSLATSVEMWPLVLPIVAVIAFAVWRNGRMDGAIRDARNLYAAGQDEASDAALARVAGATTHVYAALALFERASHDERRDDLSAALAHCDLALGRLLKNPSVKATASDILLPTILGQRARLLAALGRTDDALAELALIAREHPTFPFATATALLVRVVVALRLGDRELARDLCLSRAGDTHLPRHAELLLALVLGADGYFEADGERERIESELAASPGVRGWIERISPGLTSALASATGVRVADVDERVEESAADVTGRDGSMARRS